MATRYREEAVNTTLAQIMTRLGAPSKAEQIIKSGKGKKYPDLQTEWAGLRVAIEAKYEGPGAAEDVSSQVEERLEDALGELGIAVLYPATIRSAADLEAELEHAPLKARFASPGRIGQWQQLDGVADLVRCLDYARGLLIDDDVVKDSASQLAEAIAMFERAVAAQSARRDALLQIVSAVDQAGAGAKDLEKARKAATAISGLALLTAAMLQSELTRFDSAVPPPPASQPSELREAFIASWRQVLKRDYASIYRIAVAILEALADDELLASALVKIRSTAGKIAASRALSRHDLVGRVYHTLLADQKFLATYFTSVPAATLLAGLALQPERWPDLDWAKDPQEGPPIAIADMACGTGTLLLTAAAQVRRNWASERAEAKQSLDLPRFGEVMIEEAIQGYDVLTYALQVCGAMLLLGAPGTAVTKTGLHRMPFGGPGGRLGSLELLTGKTEAQLWGEEVGQAIDLDNPEQKLTEIPLPQVDLVIMNPPFTRSVGGSKLLGSLDGPAFGEARKRLKELCKREDVHSTLTAGLAAPFVELGRRCVRPGGRLALVLPKAVLTGDAWRKTRQALVSSFHVEYIVTSHEAGSWNFSDSTDLSEALLVCRRLGKTENSSDPGLTTTWAALSDNPATAIEALGALAAIRRIDPPPMEGAPLTVSDTLDGHVGEAFSRPAPASEKPWRHGTFSRAALDIPAEALLNREPIQLPRSKKALELPMKKLEDLATIGYDRRDVTDAFELAATSHGYPALWGQDAESMRSMGASANRELAPRTEPAPGRKLIKDREQVWMGAGQLMIAERLRVNTYRTISVFLEDRALSNTSWSINVHGDDSDNDVILALWLNSSLGILSFLAAAEETEGPWVGMKKNKLKLLPVIDPAALSDSARDGLLAGWSDLKQHDLLAISALDKDPVRAKIDAALAKALDLPVDSLAALRKLIGSEPRFEPPPSQPKRSTPSPQRQLF
jgi:hypothetical protein